MKICNKNKTTTKVALMLFIVLMTSIFAFAGTASADTYSVSASEEADFTTIQAAINAADNYDTIIVLDGIYEENVEVNKSITLVADATDALIRSNSSEAPVINVTADDVVIDGFNVDANATSSSGIFVLECDNVTVQNNDVFNATIEELPYSGNYYYYESEEDVRANYSLVVLFNCSDAIVDNNVLSDGFAGVGYISGENIYITNNDISEVNRGIKSCLGGRDYDENNEMVVAYESVQTYESGSGLFIMDNTISNIGDRGIEVMSDDSVVSGNTIDNVSFANVPLADNYDPSGMFGIKIGCSSHAVDNCTVNTNTISNFYVDEFEYDDYAYHETGVKVINSVNITITSNEIHSFYALNGSDEFYFRKQSGIQTNYAEKLTISDNYIHSFYIINTSEASRQEGISLEYSASSQDRATLQDSDSDSDLETVTYVTSNTIEDFFVENSSISKQRGIFMKHYSYLSVEDNVIGLLSINGSEPRSSGLRQYAICIDYVYESTFLNNTIDEMRFTNPADLGTLKQSGIFVEDSGNINISESSVSNIYADYIEQQSGIRVKESDAVNISGNTIKYLDVDNGELTDSYEYYGEQFGILLSSSEDSIISKNTIEEVNTVIPYFVESGVRIGCSDNIDMTGNSISNSNSTGLTIVNTDGGNFSENKIINCAQGGLLIEYSEGNLIYNNYFSNDVNILFERPGIRPRDLVTGPIVSDGPADDDETPLSLNDWNITKTAGANIAGGAFLGGNYWAHPDGTGFSQTHADADGDGIIDEQYNVSDSETEIDFLPLIFVPAPEPAPVEKKSSGSRAYVGPSQPPEDVESTGSSIQRITGGDKAEYDFGGSEGPVLGISFEPKEDKGLVVGNVQVLKDVPEDVGEHPEGIPYEIMSITLGHAGTISEENADNIIINFRVSWEWINENNIDLSTIRLMRFHDGQWQELPTIEMSDDGEFLHFTAQTPGFSVFSIVGDEAGSAEVGAAEDTTEVEVGSEEASTESTPGFTMLFSTALLAIAAVVIRRRN